MVVFGLEDVAGGRQLRQVAEGRPAAGDVVVVDEQAVGVAGCPGVNCLLYTSPSPRDRTRPRMPSSA